MLRTFVLGLLLALHAKTVRPNLERLPRPKVINLKATPHSRTSVFLRWNISRPLFNGSTFDVRYSFDRQTIVQVISTESQNNSFILKNLEPYSSYRFQVVSQHNGDVGIPSKWIKLALDVNSYLVKAQLPSEMIATFQQALYEVLPLSFLTSDMLNTTNIDLDTSMSETFYEIYFNLKLNMTSEQLTEMFERNHARAHTSYVRNVKVYLPRFCQTDRDNCHKHADCIESVGSYSCKCKADYVEMNRRSHLFPGRNCSLNTAQPVDLDLSVINPTTVLVKFRAPRQSLGSINYFEVSYQTISGETPSEIEEVEVDRSAYLQTLVNNLLPNGLHQFKARAVTSLAPGRWTKWKQVRTASNLFKVDFHILLDGIASTQYPKVQRKVHLEMERKAETALKISRTVSLTDFQITRSDVIGNATVHVQGLLYTAKIKTVNLIRIRNAAKNRLKSKFKSRYGLIKTEPILLEDYDECMKNMHDCGGSSCINRPGTYSCKCAKGLIDVSLDFDLLPGRKCIVFDAPLAFSISLLNPNTAKLTWKISPQMRKKQLFFWFVIQYKLANSDKVTEKRAQVESDDFTEESFVMSMREEDLVMATVYQFRVAVANVDNTGTFTAWQNVETSNLIFHAKLNLTLTVYSPNLLNENHALTIETAKKVRKVVGDVLGRMPQYTATGNVSFAPGIRGRTYAYAYLFFKKHGNLQTQLIQESFKHTSGQITNRLGVDFQTVNITDFDECDSVWNDCSTSANCTNAAPGYSCTCLEEYVDFSSQENKAPGRVCIHPDNITTPAPTTTPEETTTTTAPLRFPIVVLSGDAISPTRIRIKWRRMSKKPSDGLNYELRYGVKGLPGRYNTTAASTTLSVDIRNLHQGVVYQIQVAERWKQNDKPHTLYSFPIEVRTDPKAYRIYVQLPDVSIQSSLLSSNPDPLKRRLQTYMNDYFTQVFTHSDVINRHKSVRFGSVGAVTFSRHPDTGVIASSILFFLKKSKSTINELIKAFQTGEPLIAKPMTIQFMYIGDLNECSAETLNDCSPTSDCTNKVGSFDCKCGSGFVDMGPTYYLLPGRLCMSTNPPSTASSSTKLSTTTEKRATRKMQNYLPKSTTLVKTTTQPVTLAIQPVNMIGLLAGECYKGQKKIESVCQDVDLYLGQIDVIKESGSNVSASNLLGTGKDSLKEAVEVALNSAFSEIETVTGFSMSRVQDISLIDDRIKAMFVIVMNSQNLRYKRQIQFILDDFQVNAAFIQKALTDYLNEQYPIGIVQPAAGAVVMFGTNDIVISDIDECSSRSLYDCDVNLAKCKNIMGSFQCRCNNGTTDVSSDINERPGRRCRDQCNPSPCLNGAKCFTQPHVGPPMCRCKDGFEGMLCDKIVEVESNLIVVALSSLAGVLFLFLIGFVVTYRVHRKNKKKEKLKQTATNNNNIQRNIAQTSDNVELANSAAEAFEPEPFVETLPNQRDLGESQTNSLRKTLPSPPPIPARTTSIQSGGIATVPGRNMSVQSTERSHQEIDVTPLTTLPSQLDSPPSPLLPGVLPPILVAQANDDTLNSQRNNSSQSHPSADVFDDSVRIPSFSSPRPAPVAIPLAPNIPSYSPPLSQYPLEPPAPQPSKKKLKGKKLKQSTAIRGRIRRHSDSS